MPDGASVCAMADKTSVRSNPHLTPDALHNTSRVKPIANSSVKARLSIKTFEFALTIVYFPDREGYKKCGIINTDMVKMEDLIFHEVSKPGLFVTMEFGNCLLTCLKTKCLNISALSL